MKICTYPIINNETTKSTIISYIENLPINDSYKDEIKDPNFINQILPIYSKYPLLFSKIFPTTSDINVLNIAGFLYHKSVIYLDRILDEQENNSHYIILSMLCQEESIKILTTFFSLKSEFWDIWNKRRDEYFIAHHIDNVSHNINSRLDFERLADYKSAFGKIAIDSLFILSKSKDKKLYHALLDSHKYYYCALQLIDDINDLREDLSNNQFNIALYELKKN